MGTFDFRRSRGKSAADNLTGARFEFLTGYEAYVRHGWQTNNTRVRGLMMRATGGEETERSRYQDTSPCASVTGGRVGPGGCRAAAGGGGADSSSSARKCFFEGGSLPTGGVRLLLLFTLSFFCVWRVPQGRCSLARLAPSPCLAPSRWSATRPPPPPRSGRWRKRRRRKRPRMRVAPAPAPDPARPPGTPG